MTDVEKPRILESIESLVTDQLQVVSYKWLSRNFLVSSNAAKRLLQEFIENRGDGMEIVYTLSGWLKSNPSSYHIKLVSNSQLTEAKKDFSGNCSVQVYSVQVSIPKDSAALWNAEFVQAENLYTQPFTVDNCLRDNRFCGISNYSVKRNVDGIPVGIMVPRARTMELPGTLGVGLQTSTLSKEVKTENSDGTLQDLSNKPPLGKERDFSVPINHQKLNNEKNNSGAGGLLANLWGRAAANSKASTASAEAQSSHEASINVGGSHDEVEECDIKRASNGAGKRRRVVLDYSDEEEDEDAISLASPEIPKDNLTINPKQGTGRLTSELQDSEHVKAEYVPRLSSPDSFKVHGSEVEESQNRITKGASNSPKRKKIVNTRIDERGREVTEVVWEDEAACTKEIGDDAEQKEDSGRLKKSDSRTNTSKRSIAPKKSATLGAVAPSHPGGKGGSKKGGNAKNPKQGNIMSFFRKV